MNDEFLHALRRDPPPKFARALKERLRHLPARRGGRSVVRMMFAMVLIGGVAIAAALLFRDRAEPKREDPPIAQAPLRHEPQPEPARAAQPTKAQPPARRAVVPAESQPPVEKPPQGKDIPVALLTSSLTRPLAQALVDNLGKSNSFARPRLGIAEVDEAFRALCTNTDFVMVSRRISDDELALCRKWGIEVTEWNLGFLVIVLAAAPTTQLPPIKPREVFLALARRIPDPAEPARLIDNPNVTWHDVHPRRFDYSNIDVLMLPDATTRELFVNLVMEAGCDTFPAIRSLRQSDWKQYVDVCHQLRSDEHIREAELSNTLATQQLWAQPNWLVVMRYPYYAFYSKDLKTMFERSDPPISRMGEGKYVAARDVYVYAQKSHVSWSAGTRALALELTSESAVGTFGYLPRLGLVPMTAEERRKQREGTFR